MDIESILKQMTVEEKAALVSGADIIIMNPPFSLFREFLAWIIKGGKQFISMSQQDTEIMHSVKRLVQKECANYLIYMRKLYLAYPKRGTLSHKLTWSHYYEILKLDDPLEVSFYAKETEIEHWSVRELKRQMKSMLFHRLALSKDKEGVLRLAQNGVEIQKAEDIIVRRLLYMKTRK